MGFNCHEFEFCYKDMDYFTAWHVCKRHCAEGTVFKDGACREAASSVPGSCLTSLFPPAVCEAPGRMEYARKVVVDDAERLEAQLNAYLCYLKHD
jgi:hypothetical protein